jgi:cytochrome c-type biogenesis protein CcmH/NrfG
MEQGWLALGEAQLGQNRYAAAAATFRHAARINPSDWQAWYGLARAQTGPARQEALHRALALDPRETVLLLLQRLSGQSKRSA